MSKLNTRARSGLPRGGGRRRLRDQSCQDVNPNMRQPQISQYLDIIVVFVLGLIVGSLLTGLFVEFIK